MEKREAERKELSDKIKIAQLRYLFDDISTKELFDTTRFAFFSDAELLVLGVSFEDLVIDLALASRAPFLETVGGLLAHLMRQNSDKIKDAVAFVSKKIKREKGEEVLESDEESLMLLLTIVTNYILS